jgi:hypothetical protein
MNDIFYYFSINFEHKNKQFLLFLALGSFKEEKINKNLF